jgi:hypothetical protein
MSLRITAPKRYEHSNSLLNVAPSALLNVVYAHEGLNEVVSIGAEFQRVLKVGEDSVFDSYKISLDIDQARELVKGLNKVIHAIDHDQFKFQSNGSWYYDVTDGEFVL